ncbi:MAG: hypothetical protein U9N30_06315 [Campylobacterota bacterium]|nr:hypothetical protein [Campylobacterota bacterium]
MVRILSTVLILGIYSFASSANPLILPIIAKYDGQKVHLKWVPPKINNNYEYRIYRSYDKNKNKLIRKQTKISYAQAKMELSKELLEIVHPYENTKNFFEQSVVASKVQAAQKMRQGLILRKNDLAKALGVYFVDDSVRMKKIYTYTVEVYDKDSKIAFNTLRVSTQKASIPNTVTSVWMINDEHSMGLKWVLTSPFDSYKVYKKSINAVQYTKAHENPLRVSKGAKLYFKDKSIKPKQMMHYVVTVVDGFGEEGSYSLPVTGYLKSKIKMQKILNLHSSVNNKRVKLMWNKIEQKNIQYNIYRSVDPTAGFKKLNPKPLTKNMYVDKNFSLNRNYYYHVTTISSEGESEPSVQRMVTINDATPPKTPMNFSAKLLAGKVMMSWTEVKDNSLLGYRIYRTMDENNAQWEMVEKKPIAKTNYTHVLPKTLSRHFYYYKVTAVDTKFNESKASKILKIKLPDVTAPKQPVIGTKKVYKDKISLQWNNIIVHDLSHYNVYTQVEKKVVRLNKKPLIMTRFEYAVPKGLMGKRKYFITAVDKDGNESQKDKHVLINHVDLIAPMIDNVNYKRIKNSLEISFDVKDKDYNGFEIFRSSGKNPKYFNISTFQRGTQYTDKGLAKNKKYWYQIRVYDKVGNVRISDTKEILWQK